MAKPKTRLDELEESLKAAKSAEHHALDLEKTAANRITITRAEITRLEKLIVAEKTKKAS